MLIDSSGVRVLEFPICSATRPFVGSGITPAHERMGEASHRWRPSAGRGGPSSGRPLFVTALRKPIGSRPERLPMGMRKPQVALWPVSPSPGKITKTAQSASPARATERPKRSEWAEAAEWPGRPERPGTGGSGRTGESPVSVPAPRRRRPAHPPGVQAVDPISWQRGSGWPAGGGGRAS